MDMGIVMGVSMEVRDMGIVMGMGIMMVKYVMLIMVI